MSDSVPRGLAELVALREKLASEPSDAEVEAGARALSQANGIPWRLLCMDPASEQKLRGHAYAVLAAARRALR